jgi:hypothetical protein
MKYIFLAFLLAISCSKEQKSYNSSNGGKNRSNDFSKFSSVFSNYYSIYDIRFENEIDSSGFLFPPFILNENDRIYFSKNNNMHVLISDRVMSSYDFGNKYIVSQPTKDDNDNIYIAFSDGTISCFELKNRRRPILKWTYGEGDTTLNIFSDLIYNNNLVYSSIINKGISILDTNGKLITFIENNKLVRHFILTDSEQLVFCSTNDDFDIQDTLYFYSDEKELFRKTDLGRFYTAPVSKNSRVYLPAIFRIRTELLSKIYCLSESGNIEYEIETNITPKFISADSEDNIYVISNNSGLGLAVSYIDKYDKYGKKIWNLTVDLTIPSPIIIANDVLCFSGGRENSSGIFFVDKNSGKLLSSMSLENAPPYNLVPSFNPSGGLLFGASSSAKLIEAERTFLDKLLR